MLRVWIAVVLNFFLPGAGYLVLGHRIALAVLWMAALVGLTVVEFSIQAIAPSSYTLMFVSVLVMNTAFAIDAYLVGQAKGFGRSGAAVA